MFRTTWSTAVTDLTMHLLLDPREGHLWFGSKEGTVLVSMLSCRKLKDRLPIGRYFPEHPDRRRHQLIHLELVPERRTHARQPECSLGQTEARGV